MKIFEKSCVMFEESFYMISKDYVNVVVVLKILEE